MSSPVVFSPRRQSPPSPLLTALPTPEQSRAQSLALTVIIPVYNERHLVAASVGRLLALTSEFISRLAPGFRASIVNCEVSTETSPPGRVRRSDLMMK